MVDTSALKSAAPLTQAFQAKKIPTDSGQDFEFGGEEEDRTPDLCIANAALSQLSYSPNDCILSSHRLH